MAEALLGVVIENLIPLVQNELATISEIKGKIEKLSNTLDMIKGVLEDAEEKQITNRSIKVWVQQLKDAVYVLDDILDECSMESCRLGGLSTFKPKNIMFRRRIGNKLIDITRRFDQIAEGKNKFVLSEGSRERSSEVVEWRQTSSIIQQPQVYGRDDDKEKIVEFLLRQARGSDFLSIYPIVGLGGVGKTTLAQLVYNDERVSHHFNIKIWVCVSENFSIERILCSIIESITRKRPDVSSFEAIAREVKILLQSDRYLLVLDDVWKANQQLEFGLSQDKWNKLKSVLSHGSKAEGSSILVSTRDMDVAAIMGTCQAHHLDGLSEDQCWLLFKQYAFGSDKEECAKLVAIGKEIVKKCGGSPLAAQALGGLMSTRNGEKEWLEVKKSRLWTLPDENSILPALRLSYFYLTPTLKQCFAFCAMFPKDSVIMKEDLIHLWIANGFISSRENLEVEDVGNMVWNELYQKSLFQDIMINKKGDISFKMHDLVHDLAQSVTGPECVNLENANITDLSRSTRHICVDGWTYLKEEALEKVESLRTFYQSELRFGDILDCFPKKISLRALRISSFKLSSLENLIHLRYLELYDFCIETFPDSIYSLQKLEILKLKKIDNLRCLPMHLSCLQNLRHLIIEHCDSLSCMCPHIQKLSCLRTLSVYIVRSETGHSLAELHNLKLGGRLSIEGLENVCNLSEAQDANLICKKDLEELCLSWDHKFETKSHTNAEQVLEALQPHPNLKTLIIHNYEGGKFSSWNGIISSLVALELYDCLNCRQLSSLGKLPSLRKLKISFMTRVQCMDDDESYDGAEIKAFPSLKKLSLRGLSELERLLKVEKGEMFPNLSVLIIQDCPKLELPCLPSIKSLRVYGCNNVLLRSVSSCYNLTSLKLYRGGNLTSFPEEMIKSLTCLETLTIFDFPKLNELPNEFFNRNTLEELIIVSCGELEYLPEQVWEGLRSLRSLEIIECRRLRCLQEDLRYLTALKELKIMYCDELESLPEQVWEGLCSHQIVKYDRW